MIWRKLLIKLVHKIDTHTIRTEWWERKNLQNHKIGAFPFNVENIFFSGWIVKITCAYKRNWFSISSVKSDVRLIQKAEEKKNNWKAIEICYFLLVHSCRNESFLLHFHFSGAPVRYWCGIFPQNHFNKLELTSLVIILLHRYVCITIRWDKKKCSSIVKQTKCSSLDVVAMHEPASSLLASFQFIDGLICACEKHSFDLRSIVSW